MANSHHLFSLVALIIFLFTCPSNGAAKMILPKYSYWHSLRSCHFDKIYQLGDSISDAGNFIRENTSNGSLSPCGTLPYGQTLLLKLATGRCSDGLLIIDFIAKSAGLPLLKPYKEARANFAHGVNFAVAGSTALPPETLAEMNIVSSVTKSSLGVQLDWMESHFNSTCHSPTDCAKKNAKALFMVGEIGGNDYNFALLQGKSIQDLKDKLVPQVVAVIAKAVRRVIQFGANRVVVPGNFPIGCFPVYLTAFQTNDSTAYDEFRCLKDLNSFSMYHNQHLQRAIDDLKIEYPNTTIVYGDFYNSFMWIFSRARFFGFDLFSLRKACCGSGGDYNFNATKMCGAAGVGACPCPYRYMSWDGIHLTQHTYKIMAGWLINTILPMLRFHI